MDKENKTKRMDLEEKMSRGTTFCGIPLKTFYRPEDIAGLNYEEEVGDPGKFPYTRGIHSDMYRGRLWTRREMSGYGSPEDTNERMKFLVKSGMTGLNVVFDSLVQNGIDADHPRAEDEVGIAGVNINSLEDMEALFDGLPLERLNTSLVHGSTDGPILVAMYVAIVEKRGLNLPEMKGMIQMDPLTSYYCGLYPGNNPVELGVKMWGDMAEWSSKYLPKWYISTINSHAQREAGLTAPEELAAVFSRAIAYCEATVKRGVPIDDFAPRIGFYSCVDMDMLEEVAKIRAGRRIWAKIARDRFGAKDPRSMQWRVGVHTLARGLSPKEPLTNLARVAIQVLTATMAGVQSVEACAFDEACCLPTELSHQLALRTQQIVGYESGVTSVADPMGGSYCIEYLTNKIEAEAWKIIDEIESQGGIVGVMNNGWLKRRMEQGAMREQKMLESKEWIVPGFNAFIDESAKEELQLPFPIHEQRWEAGPKRAEAVRRLREERDNAAVRRTLANLEATAKSGWNVNLIPAIIEAVKAYATIGEVMGTIRQAYGYSYDPMAKENLAQAVQVL